MPRSIAIMQATLKNKIGCAVWAVTPVSIKGALYLRHRRMITSRVSIISK